MKLLAIATGVCLLAAPAFGDVLVSDNQPGSTATIENLADAVCLSSQGAVEDDNGLGLQDPTGTGFTQGPCIPGNTGDPADLEGFAFRLESCQDGFVIQSNIVVNQRDGEPHDALWHNYIWRDLGGLPFDACGLECAVATDLPIPPSEDPVLVTHDWVGAGCPCLTFAQERIYQGVVFEHIREAGSGTGQGADFFIRYDDTPATPVADLVFVNLSGAHDDWADINDLAAQYARPYHVSIEIDLQCDPVPVEPSTWGAMKNLYR